MPRARIIRRRATFDRVRQKGRRLQNRSLTLSVLPLDSATAEAARVAFLTPKRLGPATKRNRLRRRMREIYRRFLNLGDTEFYLVWIGRPPAVDLDSEELRLGMTELVRRLDNR